MPASTAEHNFASAGSKSLRLRPPAQTPMRPHTSGGDTAVSHWAHWLHSWFYRNTAATTLTSMVKLYIGHENRLRISSRDRTPISASQSFWRHFSRTETRLKNKNRSVWLVWQCRPVCMPKRCWMCIQSMSYIIILTWCVLENILLCCKCGHQNNK